MPAPRRPRLERPVPRGSVPVWFAELIKLTQEHGYATARLWHERARLKSIPRSSSDRQWERLKITLVEHGVPHDKFDLPPSVTDDAPGAIAIRMKIGPTDVDKHATRWKQCKKDDCGRWKPPRTPYFHHDVTRLDGLHPYCAECRRVERMRKYHEERARGGQERVGHRERLRASARVASARFAATAAGRTARLKKNAHRQARTALANKLRAARSDLANAHALMCHGTPRGFPGGGQSANNKDHTGGDA